MSGIVGQSEVPASTTTVFFLQVTMPIKLRFILQIPVPPFSSKTIADPVKENKIFLKNWVVPWGGSSLAFFCCFKLFFWFDFHLSLL